MDTNIINKMEHIECSICLVFIDKTENELTDCKHNFHKECLSTWKKINNTCPLCRKSIDTFHSQFCKNKEDIFQLTPSRYQPSGRWNQSRINDYSFSLIPEIPQPSGRQNRSRIDVPSLNITYSA
jgi:hypothetical protein